MTPTIAVIIPTVGGRQSLAATIASSRADEPVWVHTNTLGGYGHPARNEVLDSGHIRATHYVSIDDDDVFLPGAFDTIRSAIRTNSDRWFLFRMTFGEGSHCPGVTVWNEKRIRIGNVGTPMIVAPTTAKARWGTGKVSDMPYGDLPWMRGLGDGYFGDWEYATALAAELGPPVWCDPIIATIRPRVVEAVA